MNLKFYIPMWIGSSILGVAFSMSGYGIASGDNVTRSIIIQVIAILIWALLYSGLYYLYKNYQTKKTLKMLQDMKRRYE
jgi:hypothetical protein